MADLIFANRVRRQAAPPLPRPPAQPPAQPPAPAAAERLERLEWMSFPAEALEPMITQFLAELDALQAQGKSIQGGVKVPPQAGGDGKQVRSFRVQANHVRAFTNCEVGLQNGQLRRVRLWKEFMTDQLRDVNVPSLKAILIRYLNEVRAHPGRDEGQF